MNIDFLPEGKSDTVFEAVNVDAVISDDIMRRAGRKSIISAVLTLSCAILCFVSITLHALAACRLGETIISSKESIISVIIPYARFTETPENLSPPKEPAEEEKQKDEPVAKYVAMDLSSGAEGAVDISNETSYTPDLNTLLNMSRPVGTVSSSGDAPEDDGKPLVLIYHTHGTEAYADCASSSFRSSDISKNVVAVGDALVDTLAAAGIRCIHITEMFDSENWSAAYDTSTVAVREQLALNPSVKYILDIHRDCIGNEESGYIKALTAQSGYDLAQLMFVCGTDQGGSNHTSWEKNLTFALQLQHGIWKDCSTLMRPIDLRCASFYQDTGAGALLVEFGTCANTLSEAQRSAVVFGKSLADYILGRDSLIDSMALMKKY